MTPPEQDTPTQADGTITAHSTSAYDLTRQARWEVEATRRAAARYHEAAAVVDPETLPSGKRLLRLVVPPLIKLIEVAQTEAQDELMNAGGTRSGWAWPIQLLEAEPLALITTIACFRAALDADRTGDRCDRGTTHLSRDLAFHIRHELEYRAWVAANKTPGEGQRDVLAAFKARYPTATTRVWTRFRRRLEAEHRLEPWPTAVALQVGAKLIALALEAAPDVFVKVTRYIGQGRRQHFLELTPKAQEMVDTLEARASVARPFRYPMLIKPNDWRYPTDASDRRLPDTDRLPADPCGEARPHGDA